MKWLLTRFAVPLGLAFIALVCVLCTFALRGTDIARDYACGAVMTAGLATFVAAVIGTVYWSEESKKKPDA